MTNLTGLTLDHNISSRAAIANGHLIETVKFHYRLDQIRLLNLEKAKYMGLDLRS